MEAISFLSDWITWLLIIIPVATGAVVTYLALKKSLSFNMDEKADYDRKIKQTIKGAIIGISISGIITVIKKFYI